MKIITYSMAYLHSLCIRAHAFESRREAGTTPLACNPSRARPPRSHSRRLLPVLLGLLAGQHGVAPIALEILFAILTWALDLGPSAAFWTP